MDLQGILVPTFVCIVVCRSCSNQESGMGHKNPDARGEFNGPCFLQISWLQKLPQSG